MKIYYGLRDNIIIDVTDFCNNILKTNNIIIIPKGELTRDFLFQYRFNGKNKIIYIENEGTIYQYDENIQIEINTLNNEINNKININKSNINENEIINKLNYLHSKLKIEYGSFDDEVPEQKMSIRYLKGNEKVLEIGGNIGRNSLIISSLLKNSNNLITLECNKEIYEQLIKNKDLNNLNFNIENSALSKRKIIQKGWESIPSEILLPDHEWVNTITFDELQKKYNIEFDTLVLDCEGAFYYILQDFPEILNNIKLIIMENDYNNINHKIYIDDILKNNNFNIYHSERGGWGPCYTYFFETWIKI